MSTIRNLDVMLLRRSSNSSDCSWYVACFIVHFDILIFCSRVSMKCSICYRVTWMTLVFILSQCYRYLTALKKNLPSVSPTDTHWPSSSPLFRKTNGLLKDIYHAWRVSCLIMPSCCLRLTQLETEKAKTKTIWERIGKNKNKLKTRENTFRVA